MKRLSIIIITLLTVLTAAAQATKFDYIFEEGVRQKLANNYDAAIDLFDYCRQLNPESAAALSELSNLYRYTGNDSLSLAKLEEACRLAPKNYWYRNRLVLLYLENHMSDMALAHAEEMATLFPNKNEILMMLFSLYEEKEDYPNIIKVLEKIELKEGKSEQISMEKFRTYLHMNDEKLAFEEMTSLANEYPNDLRYQVMIGDLTLDAGKKEEALEIYKAVEAKDSTNTSLLLSLTNYYENEGNDSLYQSYLTRLITNPTIDEMTRLRMMAVVVRENLEQKGDSSVVLGLFDKIKDLPTADPTLLELMVSYMVTVKMPPSDIRPHLQHILRIDPENNKARQQLLAYAIEEEDTTGIIAICQPAVDFKTKDAVFYYYLGIAHLQRDEYQQALDVLQASLPCIHQAESTSKTQLLTNTYGLMGDIYHKLGDDDKAFQAYDSCLVYQQSNATVLNNYAYYLSLKKKQLDKAEEMSRKSNELEPDNSTYLDTYAWVLFQLKRYEEAKQYMDKAVEIMKRDEEEISDEIQMHIDKINKKAKKR